MDTPNNVSELRPEERISANDALGILESITLPYERLVEDIRPHKGPNSLPLDYVISKWENYRLNINDKPAICNTTLRTTDEGTHLFPNSIEHVLVSEALGTEYWLVNIEALLSKDEITNLPAISNVRFHWSGSNVSQLKDILPEIEATKIKDELDLRYPPMRKLEAKVDIGKLRGLGANETVKLEESESTSVLLAAALKLIPLDSDFFILNRPTIWEVAKPTPRPTGVQKFVGRLGINR
jgi:hypothetical protein